MKKEEVNTSDSSGTDGYPPIVPGMPAQKKRNSPISPKENYEMFYSGKLPMWLPLFCDIRLMSPRLHPDNMARCAVIDANPLSEQEKTGGKDIFGIEWKYIPVAGGSMVEPGTPLLSDVNDWERLISFPDVNTWDWEGAAKSNAKLIGEDRFICVSIFNGLFERLISFMDFEGAALALIDDDQKGAVHALFSALCDHYEKIIENYKKYFNAQLINFHDDWGSQRSPFFSLDTAMEMLVPYLGRLADCIHSKGMYLDLHSCGKNELLVPAYIEAGVDTWSGQPMNDTDMLFSKYGDKIKLGLYPDIAFTAETTDKSAAQSGKRFVRKYGSFMEHKPFNCAEMMAPDAFNDAVYEESLKMFG